MDINESTRSVVSVRLMTYNQEEYIAQAIESALDQRTSFSYEIVIGDDFSTDRTMEIARGYESRFPGKVRCLPREHHLGRLNNFVDILNNCTGTYVALLDGDDYWTDPLKLQKQAEFLDRCPDFSACYHRVYEIRETTDVHATISPEPAKPIVTIEDLLRGYMIPACSVLFRRGLFSSFPEWFSKVALGDWPLHILNAHYGPIGLINEVMSVYRIHSGSIWSGADSITRLRGLIDTREYLLQYLDPKYAGILHSAISQLSLLAASEHANQNQLDRARSFYWRSIQEDYGASIRRPLDLIVLALRLYAPSLYKLAKTIADEF